MSTFDERTEKNITTLHPALQPLARRFVTAAQLYLDTHVPGVVIRIISGYRTYAEQNKLYAQGRTAPGNIVTNARAGYSNHNFRSSFDCGLFRGSDYLEDSPLYHALGAVGKSVGLAWGGDWKFKDEPHYELNHGLSMETLRNRCDASGNPNGDILAGTPYAATKPAPAPATPPAAPGWTAHLPGLDPFAVPDGSTWIVRRVAEALGATVTADPVTHKIAVLKPA